MSKTAPAWRQYWTLTKPRVVALIVFTAVIGMFLAVPGLPPLREAVFGTLGIWLAAASAAAINHLIDQRIDKVMVRTADRPLATGALNPSQVLAFAVCLGALSMAILIALVNPLTAGLTFASLIGYAIVYTGFLKRATPQNIVIGGIAGAAPPLLGWAAVTGMQGARDWEYALLLVLIIFQALLGMWTVTWLLKPIVVMAHLLGGLLTFSLLTWMAWRATDIPIRIGNAAKLRRMLIAGVVLLGVQIALGGWTSANYAALACGTDFPKCAGAWWPAHDFREGFVLWRGIGVDYEGGILDNQARVAIQLAHRLMALLVFGHVLALAIRLLRSPGLRGWGALLGVLLFAQIGLGIANVLLSLPLHVAVLHNAGATALLFVLVSLLARVRAPDA